VNLASRLQGLNKELGTEILLSGSTRSRMEAGIALKALPPQHVKGRSQQVEVYTFVS
jgi:adenylate cyclase